jgi:hypothetical protein
MNKDFNFEMVNEEILKIRQQIKKDNKSLFRRYILCLIKFNKLFENIVKIRYMPPFGKGYIEAKIRFEKLRYINLDECGEYFQYKLY